MLKSGKNFCDLCSQSRQQENALKCYRDFTGRSFSYNLAGGLGETPFGSAESFRFNYNRTGFAPALRQERLALRQEGHVYRDR